MGTRLAIVPRERDSTAKSAAKTLAPGRGAAVIQIGCLTRETMEVAGLCGTDPAKLAFSRAAAVRDTTCRGAIATGGEASSCDGPKSVPRR